MVAVDRGRFTCVVEDAGRSRCTAMRARELGRKSVVVGDRVRLVGDITGAPGALARIVRIEERTSVLRRTADDDDPPRLERVVVANADQLVIVTALADPPPRTGFIDRCLVAAYDAGIEPLLLLTKADLADPAAVLDYYADLDLPYVLVPARRATSTSCAAGWPGGISVLVGHSGVGKSTLVNRLVPGRRPGGRRGERDRQGPAHVDQRGGAAAAPGRAARPGLDHRHARHPASGWPTSRAESLLHGFPDLVEGTVECPPSCDHSAPSAA